MTVYIQTWLFVLHTKYVVVVMVIIIRHSEKDVIIWTSDNWIRHIRIKLAYIDDSPVRTSIFNNTRVCYASDEYHLRSCFKYLSCTVKLPSNGSVVYTTFSTSYIILAISRENSTGTYRTVVIHNINIVISMLITTTFV